MKQSTKSLSPEIREAIGDDLLLTCRETAAILRRSPRSLERMRREGTGPKWFRLHDSPNAPAIYTLGNVRAYLRARAGQ